MVFDPAQDKEVEPEEVLEELDENGKRAPSAFKLKYWPNRSKHPEIPPPDVRIQGKKRKQFGSKLETNLEQIKEIDRELGQKRV